MNYIIRNALAVTTPLIAYGLSVFYLKQVAKKPFESLVAVLGSALGGWGAIILIISAIIPHAMPGALAFLLLLIPILMALGVFIIRTIKNRGATKDLGDN